MYQSVLKFLTNQFSGERIKHLAEPIYQNDRWSSFDKYHQTAHYCRNKMKEFGLKDIEIISHPADGKSWCGDWIAPLGWIAHKGLARISSPESEKGKLLADYESTPNHLVRWSASTRPGGEEIEVIYMEDASDVKQYEGKDVKGKLIFTHTDVYARGTKKLACDKGARGIIFDHSWGGVDYPDNVCWNNVWHNDIGWGPTIGDPPLIGIMISPRQGAYLQRLVKNNKKVIIYIDIDAKIKPDTIDIITGIIPGKNKKEEVLVLGHIYECGADDNASGAGVMLEIGRVLTELIRKGEILKPHRSIRILLGWEWLSPTYWAWRNQKKLKNIVAAICLDAVAMRQDLTKASFIIRMNPHVQSSFTDCLIENLYKEYFKDRNSLFKWQTGPYMQGTDVFYSDPMINIPTVYPAQNPGKGWHSSFDCIENLSNESLEAVAATTATYLYYIAKAGEDEAIKLTQDVYNAAQIKLLDTCRDYLQRDFKKIDKKEAIITLRDRLEYHKMCFAKALESTRRLDLRNLLLKKEINFLKAKLNKLVEEEFHEGKRRLEYLFRNISPFIEKIKTPRWKILAENMVPRRIIFGPIFFTARMPENLREKYLSLSLQHKDAIFWVDGKRNLREIIKVHALEKEQEENGQIVKLFQAYEKSGYIKINHRVKVKKDDIIKGLRNSGVKTGDVLLIHSSLSNLGHVIGGALTVIRAFKEAVGPGGTIAMPTFTYSVTSLNRPPYNYKKTSSDQGIISDTFWREPQVLRSKHPSHSLAACGRYAELITKDHEKYNPYAREGGFGKLYQLNAKIIMLGCGLAPNSTLHAVEDWANHPCMIPEEYHTVASNGKIVKVTYDKEPQGHREFYLSNQRLTKSEKLLRGKRIIKDGKIGLAIVHIMEMHKLMNFCLKYMSKDPNFLLCDDPACDYCSQKKKEALRKKKAGKLIYNANLKAIRYGKN